ncbi:hypothetical protein IWGMT90018_36840 [Mycobacterium kiyosense]|nr:hypothetical protein IWGMT90018_36840 [Mycobacterium kiyosense]
MPANRPAVSEGQRVKLAATNPSTRASTSASVIRSVRETTVANAQKSMSPAQNNAATFGTRSRIARAQRSLVCARR